MITFGVYECREFPTIGNSYGGIKSASEAVKVYKSVDSERLYGIPVITIRVLEKFDDPDDYEEMDLYDGKRFEFGMLKYYPKIANNKQAVQLILELFQLLPGALMVGPVPKNILEFLYPVGTKVRLISMNDTQAPPYGTCGRVDYIDNIGQIHVRWETGSSLALVPGWDKFTKVEE